MKHHKSGNLNRWRAAGLLVGAVGLATGCAEPRVEYVPAVSPQAAYNGPVAPAPVAPPAPAAVLRSSTELDRMLGPIALYPDPLIAQILPAATLPEQVVLADRYVRGGGDPAQIDQQTWDLSLKALARYPSVLQMMDDNLAWTTDLGQAFLSQPAEVMNSIQRLRAEAQALGNLQSTPQETVIMDEGAIEIVPANPEVIYVPVYQPDVVYFQRPPGGGLQISFGVGFAIGAWLNHDCDWHDHAVIAWHHDHPRPADWWYHPGSRGPRPAGVKPMTVANNRPAGNQPFTVWHPQARPAVSGADRADRGWAAPSPQQARSPAPSKNTRPVAAAKDTHPATVGRDVRPAPAPAAPPREPRPAPAPRPAAQLASRPAKVPAAARPAARVEPAPSRPSGAFAGMESARATRESSSRGQQSRETITRAAAPARSSAPAPSAPSHGGGDSGKHR